MVSTHHMDNIQDTLLQAWIVFSIAYAKLNPKDKPAQTPSCVFNNHDRGGSSVYVKHYQLRR